MSGTLYVVGTPIGNLGDLSPRAADTLRTVDFIAAEDTRVTRKLLSHLEIHTPLVSYHEHNRHESGQAIAGRLLNGESAALCTDAGMPCVSDPGADLVALCAERAVPVVVVPGPNAAVSALALSGLPSGRFCFEGFLSTGTSARRKHLAELQDEPRDIVLYEAPHKLRATLADLRDALGDRRVAICRELTKLHEECRRTTLSEAADYYAETPPRGEFVLVVQGLPPAPAQPEVELDAALAMARALLDKGVSTRDAARSVASRTGHPRRAVYEGLLAAREAMYRESL